MRPGEMVTTLHQRQTDGQWFARDIGIDRYTRQPYCYWRPVYPDAPRPTYGRIWKVEEDHGYVEPPKPQQTAVDVDVMHPSIPVKVRRAHDTAQAQGWTVTLQRAVSPDGVHMLCLKASAHPGRRVSMVWKWHQGRWGKEKGQPKWFPAEFGNDGAWIVADSRITPTTHTDAEKELTR